MKFYGLKYVGGKHPELLIKLLTWDASRGGEEFGTSVQFNLTLNYEGRFPWLVTRKDVAEKARITNTAWYNRDYETPGNPYSSEELEVVEVTLET